MFSYALDYAIWGLNPPGFHLTNIIFHTLNTILVFILTVRLIDYGMVKQYLYTKKALVAGIVTALLFGIHPLHVESVAWVAEKKGRLICLLLSFKHHQLSQIYLPAFKRFRKAGILRCNSIKDTKRAILEKVPLFVLSGLSSVITLWAQQTGGAIRALVSYSPE